MFLGLCVVFLTKNNDAFAKIDCAVEDVLGHSDFGSHGLEGDPGASPKELTQYLWG